MFNERAGARLVGTLDINFEGLGLLSLYLSAHFCIVLVFVCLGNISVMNVSRAERVYKDDVGGRVCCKAVRHYVRRGCGSLSFLYNLR